MKTKIFPLLTGTCVLLLLLTPAARAADTDATNTPSAAIPAASANSKSPTFAQTAAWLKNTFNREGSVEVVSLSISKSWVHDKMFNDASSFQIEINPDGDITLLTKTVRHVDGEYIWKTADTETFSLANVESAYVCQFVDQTNDFGVDHFVGPIPFQVNLKATKGGQNIFRENNDSTPHYVDQLPHGAFMTTNRETADRVTKAFNHLIEISKKDNSDDLFK